VSNLDIVRDEFSRQAHTFDSWAAQTDERSGQRFVDALGEASRGAVLDVACGPGVISQAVSTHASSVVAFDATEEMLKKARARCASADCANVSFQLGDAHHLPFRDGCFDGVVSRLAVHHFADPAQVLREMTRVLRPGGMLVIADIIVSADPDDAALQNAIEILRDPSHVAMLSQDGLRALFHEAGLTDVTTEVWDKAREFDEWMGIVNEPSRAQPLKVLVEALAQCGRHAGMGLHVSDGRLVFFHRWCLMSGHKMR
jgi:2-polyprenyl-3-methyl-5-hydroxy-6-metoxy-1,4-benzoquinol methylase